MPRSCGTHLLLAHSMVMPTVISASCHTSLHMSRALDSKIWKHASKYFQSPIHWLQPLGTWTPSIINKQSQHISSIIMILKFLLIWVCIINISLVNTNHQVGDFLYNNYKQALDLITNGEHILLGFMKDLNVTDIVTFELWLREEKSYLKGLQCEPQEEMLMMEYWQRLVKLSEST